jgi:Glutamate-ammonia ligase adenylyltransferase
LLIHGRHLDHSDGFVSRLTLHRIVTEPVERAVSRPRSTFEYGEPTRMPQLADDPRLLRTAVGDLLDFCDVETVCRSLSATTEATLDAALQVAMRAVAADHSLAALPLWFAVIAMGRLGGAEIGYGWGRVRPDELLGVATDLQCQRDAVFAEDVMVFRIASAGPRQPALGRAKPGASPLTAAFSHAAV